MKTIIFDIGKTNKKIVVFNESHKVRHQESIQLDEILDDDGFACDDLEKLTEWIISKLEFLVSSKFKVQSLKGKNVRSPNSKVQSQIKVNFSAYGASWVHLDAGGKPLTPLYNYLKPLPNKLKEQFDKQYGIEKVAQETGSPYSGMLNSGLQLFWLKYAKPEVFNKIKYSLHLPQYLSYLISGKMVSEYTSIGCHTMLWDLKKQDYHTWVYAEGFDKIQAPIVKANHTELVCLNNQKIKVGIGIHDSSASLFPYFKKSVEPFMLLSTGTWCVAMNPFAEFKENKSSKFKEELFYLTIDGKPVKATRLMLGKEYEEGVQKIADEFGVTKKEVQSLKFKVQSFKQFQPLNFKLETLNSHLVQKQKAAILEAKGNSNIKKLFVEGGFAKNDVFVQKLREELKDWEIILSENSQGTALGAALILE